MLVDMLIDILSVRVLSLFLCRKPSLLLLLFCLIVAALMAWSLDFEPLPLGYGNKSPILYCLMEMDVSTDDQHPVLVDNATKLEAVLVCLNNVFWFSQSHHQLKQRWFYEIHLLAVHQSAPAVSADATSRQGLCFPQHQRVSTLKLSLNRIGISQVWLGDEHHQVAAAAAGIVPCPLKNVVSWAFLALHGCWPMAFEHVLLII